MAKPRTHSIYGSLLRTPGLLALAVLAGCGSEAPPELKELQRQLRPKPGYNVIVVSFDALRPDALGQQGATPSVTPRLDAFAERGLTFDNAYSVAPVTPTSFAAAFTGLLPTRVFHGWKLVYSDTLAQRFADAGYRTGGFINNVQLTRERNFDAGFGRYEVYRDTEDEVILRDSLDWLGEAPGEPTFAWIHFLTPHAPYDVREVAAHLYDGDYRGRFEETSGLEFETEDPAEIERIKSLYRGEVYYADTLFGLLYEGLEAAGLLERSIILVTSDHGEEFMEHGGFQHERLTEEHVRIPLILHHPEIRRPLRSSLLVSNVDFLPTLLSLAGIELDRETDGRDLTRIDREPEWIVGISMTPTVWRWVSLRRGRHKLIQTCRPELGRVLFDLEADPGERNDLCGENPNLGRELFRDLGAILGGPPCDVMLAAVRDDDATVGLSAENVEALKALGYLGN